MRAYLLEVIAAMQDKCVEIVAAARSARHKKAIRHRCLLRTKIQSRFTRERMMSKLP